MCWVMVRTLRVVYSGRIWWLCCGRHRGGDGARTGRGNRDSRSGAGCKQYRPDLYSNAKLVIEEWNLGLVGKTRSTSGKTGAGGEREREKEKVRVYVILSRRERKQGAVPQQQQSGLWRECNKSGWRNQVCCGRPGGGIL